MANAVARAAQRRAQASTPADEPTSEQASEPASEPASSPADEQVVTPTSTLASKQADEPAESAVIDRGERAAGEHLRTSAAAVEPTPVEAPAPVDEPEQTTKLVDAAQVLAAVLGAPRERGKVHREALFARVPVDVLERLERYTSKHNVTRQDVVTMLIGALLDDAGQR